GRGARRADRRPAAPRAPGRRYCDPRSGRAAGVTTVSAAPPAPPAPPAPAAPPAPSATEALLGVYARVGPVFVRGEGAELVAEDGARYLDFVAGIGVNALGYDHPVIRAAVDRALGTGLIHVS